MPFSGTLGRKTPLCRSSIGGLLPLTKWVIAWATNHEDSVTPKPLMRSVLFNGEVIRTPTADDIAGRDTIYGLCWDTPTRCALVSDYILWLNNWDFTVDTLALTGDAQVNDSNQSFAVINVSSADQPPY